MLCFEQQDHQAFSSRLAARHCRDTWFRYAHVALVGHHTQQLANPEGQERRAPAPAPVPSTFGACAADAAPATRPPPEPRSLPPPPRPPPTDPPPHPAAPAPQCSDSDFSDIFVISTGTPLFSKIYCKTNSFPFCYIPSKQACCPLFVVMLPEGRKLCMVICVQVSSW